MTVKNAKYEVYYGCEEWQDVEYFNSLAKAQKRYDELEENRPSMGFYPVDYLRLTKMGPPTETLQSYEWEKYEE